MSKMRVTAILMTGLVLAAPVLAQQTAPAPAATTSYPEWDKLTPDQRKALVDPVRSRWNDNPDMRDEMIKRAQHWQRMTPEQREAAHRGMRRWENLTPEQRKAMHEQWKSMSPEQRKAWLDANVPKMSRPQGHR
ncbi:MAG: DUF3106 domain-containing protein [Xanthomonadales bacterium]|nr:DUF3106 domain-containing protein [Xanthomonadales bacterium]